MHFGSTYLKSFFHYFDKILLSTDVIRKGAHFSEVMNMFLFLWMSIFFSFFSFFLLSPLIFFSRLWFRVPNNHTIAVVHQKAFSHRALLKTLVRGFKNQTCIWLLMASTIAHWDQYISTLEREIHMGCYHARPSGLSHLWSFFLFHSNPFLKD